MIASFADQAAVALEIADRRHDAEEVLVLNDRDRIARDLHDVTIQRLFANGLSLQAALARLADRSEVASRVQGVVDDLDGTIKMVRPTVFALRERDRPGGAGLRAKLLAETDRAAASLGCTPALRMTGLLDTAVPAGHADHLLAVLGEALANTARHAHATAVEVTDSELRLRVADNGRGIAQDVTRRSGLANLQQRAAQLAGTCTLTPNQPTGTILEWTAPLAADE
ncbi:histidine kinase [Streptomyces phaeochromogenes]|uniref:sensor histidine kinase n=1 Tax=Streptomyces phaeochromogenes TaxID=1923 RepID=UPI002E28FB3F|nr:histidine kinase [Streptomyces phaeochromogenes]